jgi:predicted membrane channel-forming protein YqfA (hemolysin III family)
MSAHYKGIGLALLLLVTLFVSAAVAGQNLIAFSILFSGLVLMFVFSIAYMRPNGRSPEHHGKVDRVVNDTKP